ncbi:MAG TPA: pilus assembly protein TadG-related protein [Arthrobacter sp.]
MKRKPVPDGERGAVTVIVAFAMVALIGCAAIAIDTGALYSERAQLQSGADAAALAIAQECSMTTNCTNPALKMATAQDFANANSNDGASRVSSLTYPSSNAVTVQTATKDGKTGAGYLSLTFAPVLGIKTDAVAATSTAQWGSPARGPAVLPLTFAPCNFKLNGAIQVISRHGDTGGTPCSSTSPSGQLLPGGFGWLSTPSGVCNASVDVALNAMMTSDTGISLPTGCAAVLAANADKTVLLPVYSDLSGAGAGGWYKITGWAAFKLLGWNYPGSSYQSNAYTGATCKGSCKGIIGQFVSFVSLDDNFTGTGADLGANIVTLIG